MDALFVLMGKLVDVAPGIAGTLLMGLAFLVFMWKSNTRAATREEARDKLMQDNLQAMETRCHDQMKVLAAKYEESMDTVTTKYEESMEKVVAAITENSETLKRLR